MWIMAEYWCDACRWRGESLEQKPVPEHVACGLCGAPAEHVISAPKVKTVWGWVQRGKNSPDDKPPRAVDTEALADGMQLHQWKAMRAAKRADERRARIRKMLG